MLCMYIMSCETGTDSNHIAYIKVISCDIYLFIFDSASYFHETSNLDQIVECTEQ